MPKRQVDMQKTQLKTQSAKEIAIIKSRDEHRGQIIDMQKDVRQNRVKLLSEALRSTKKPGEGGR